MRLSTIVFAAVLAMGTAAWSQNFPAGGVGTHFADGGGWSTTLLLSNFSDSANSVRVQFFNTSGAPVQVRVSTDNGDPAIVSERGVDLRPQMTAKITTVGTSPDPQTGWINVVGVGGGKPVTGTVIFRQRVAGRPDYEAAVPLAYSNKNAYILQFDNTDNYVSAVAIGNALASPASVQIDAWDENGTQLMRNQNMNMGGLNQTSFVLADRFSGLAGKRGWMWIRSNTAGLTLFGLRFNPTGPFTALGGWSN